MVVGRDIGICICIRLYMAMTVTGSVVMTVRMPLGGVMTLPARVGRRLAMALNHRRRSQALPGQGQGHQDRQEDAPGTLHTGILGRQTGKRALRQVNHWRAVRTFGGSAPGWLVRNGLISSPPRRV